MEYEVLYDRGFALARLRLQQGERVLAESGAMVSMSPTISLDAKMSGGGLLGAFKSGLGGETLFRTTFVAERGPGELTLAPGALGDILALELAGQRFYAQPGAYLAGVSELTIETKGSLRGMLSGEGLFLLEIQGSGLLLLSSFGAIHEKRLEAGEEYIVDTGHLVAMEASVTWNIEKATGPSKGQGIGGVLKGLMKSALTGEGFVCRFRGPGTLYIQTRQLPGFARLLVPFLPSSHSSS